MPLKVSTISVGVQQHRDFHIYCCTTRGKFLVTIRTTESVSMSELLLPHNPAAARPKGRAAAGLCGGRAAAGVCGSIENTVKRSFFGIGSVFFRNVQRQHLVDNMLHPE